MSLGKILAVQSTPALPAEMTTPGRRSWMDRRPAIREPERIPRNRRGNEHRSAAAPPAPIAVAINNIEDGIDLISNRPAKTSAQEWTINHVRDSNRPPKTIHPERLSTTTKLNVKPAMGFTLPWAG